MRPEAAVADRPSQHNFSDSDAVIAPSLVRPDTSVSGRICFYTFEYRQPMEIVQATTAQQIEQARQLFREYEAWLGLDLCFQGFEQELTELPGRYAQPTGRLLLAFEDDEPVGCVALRKLSDDTCEMKRLFLRPEFQGRGLGRQLLDAGMREARAIGYQRMRLDTLPEQMGKAVAVYRAIGFKEIEPYNNNPVPGSLFMELVLK
jgi:GNAT superfamily N-acetyltransferase